MEAMLSMKRMMESNVAAIAATSAAAKVDPTHPSAINQANQPILNMANQGGEVLGITSGPHMGHNRNAYPPNYTPPNVVPIPNETAMFSLFIYLPFLVNKSFKNFV